MRFQHPRYIPYPDSTVRLDNMINELSSAAWATLGVLVIVLTMLIASRRPPDVIMWAGLALLLVIPVRNDGVWQLGVVSVSSFKLYVLGQFTFFAPNFVIIAKPFFWNKQSLI